MKTELVKYGDLKPGDLFYFIAPVPNAAVQVRTEYWNPDVQDSETVVRLTPEPPAAGE